MKLFPRPVKYRGTLTGLRISSVNGTAFIDNAGATIPTYADGNHLIEIYDASNRMLSGYLKAAGAGETLSLTELVTSWASRGDPLNYNPFTNVGKDVTAAVNTDHNAIADINDGVGHVTTAGALYKDSHTITLVSGTAPRIDIKGFGGDDLITFLADGANLIYWTSVNGNNRTGYYNNQGAYAACSWSSVASVKQVTAPSTSGATIVTTKGGTTYNFLSKNASFTYNAASYYCIVRKVR
jgi:hypothetical protein